MQSIAGNDQRINAKRQFMHNLQKPVKLLWKLLGNCSGKVTSPGASCNEIITKFSQKIM